MMRLITVAATAAAIALPAMAQPSLRVSTVGKSPDQVRADVHRAATKVCGRANNWTITSVENQRVCVRDAVRNTYAKAGIAQPTTLARR